MAGNISLTFLSFILLTCLSSLSSIQCASFFGSNIVALPLQDARSSTSLSFRFKTSRPDGLLFLAAGTVDYLLVTLESGHIKVSPMPVTLHMYSKPFSFNRSHILCSIQNDRVTVLLYRQLPGIRNTNVEM